jgi:hypothetical protein
MRVPWKVIGLAGVAGVAATGVVVARKRRTHTEYDPDELRDRLHERLGDVADEEPVEPEPEPEAGSGAEAAAGDGATGSAEDAGGDAEPEH